MSCATLLWKFLTLHNHPTTWWIHSNNLKLLIHLNKLCQLDDLRIPNHRLKPCRKPYFKLKPSYKDILTLKSLPWPAGCRYAQFNDRLNQVSTQFSTKLWEWDSYMSNNYLIWTFTELHYELCCHLARAPRRALLLLLPRTCPASR